jgi:hypothetical protein
MIREKMEVYKVYIRIIGKDKSGKTKYGNIIKKDVCKNYRKGERKNTFKA